MDNELLKKHIEHYLDDLKSDLDKHERDLAEREERIAFYQSYHPEKIMDMEEEDLFEYLRILWAMLIWGNKHYAVDRLISDNGFDNLKKHLADLVWSGNSIEKRWDRFRGEIKGMGPAMMSEILCHTHPKNCMLWNRRAYVGLNYLSVQGLPRYDYQMTGKKYSELSKVTSDIAIALEEQGVENPNLLTVDYFIWDELQVEKNLSRMFQKEKSEEKTELEVLEDSKEAKFIHNEIRDKIADIGSWLGFKASTEIKIASGSKVDAIWEATIGNMGRIVYVFEVQTKGSLDSLILNLLKSLNNPAVQGVVAVSDEPQLETIQKHVENVGDLHRRLRCWNYEEVLRVHDELKDVNETINKLGLVPESF